jgi:DNA-binding PadR family transcriptional regulator
MDKKKDELPSNKELDEREKIRSYIEEMTKNKKAPVAKDLVKLKHVDVKKQKVSQETLDLANTLKEQYLKHDQFERLSADELTILESFISGRMFLSRIAIVANQSRIPLGIEPYKKADLERILNSLMEKGYIESEQVGDNMVYFLTERGKYRIQ